MQPGLLLHNEGELRVNTRSRLLGVATRFGLAGAVAAGMMVFSFGVGVPSSGASGSYSANEASFCKALVTWAETNAKYAAPSGTGLTAYKSWAKRLLPFYESLDATAPNAATKLVLDDVVTVLKDYYSSSSIKKLVAYELANHAKFEADTKSLAKSISGCAKYM